MSAVDYENDRGYEDDNRGYDRDGSRSPRIDNNGHDSRARSASPGARDRTDSGPAPETKEEQEARNPGTNLFVTGIHPRLSEAEVTALFEKYGEVEKCNIMRDPHSGDSRGFGFVKMVTSEQADAAREGLQGMQHEGRTLSIEKARRARPRTPTPGKYYGPPKREFGGPGGGPGGRPRGGGRFEDRRGGYGGRRDDFYGGGGGRYGGDRGGGGGSGGYRDRYDDRYGGSSGGGGGGGGDYGSDRRYRDRGDYGRDRYGGPPREDRYAREDRRGGGSSSGGGGGGGSGSGYYGGRDDRAYGDAPPARESRDAYGGRSYNDRSYDDRGGDDRYSR